MVFCPRLYKCVSVYLHTHMFVNICVYIHIYVYTLTYMCIYKYMEREIIKTERRLLNIYQHTGNVIITAVKELGEMMALIISEVRFCHSTVPSIFNLLLQWFCGGCRLLVLHLELAL